MTDTSFWPGWRSGSAGRAYRRMSRRRSSRRASAEGPRRNLCSR